MKYYEISENNIEENNFLEKKNKKCIICQKYIDANKDKRTYKRKVASMWFSLSEMNAT